MNYGEKKNMKNYKIGIDIGGTKMAAILWDGRKVVADYVLATQKDSLEHFLVMLKALVEPLEERARHDKVKIVGVGVGVAGAIDLAHETVFLAPNIRILEGVHLVQKVKEILGYEVKMDNDTRCFLRAEVKRGAAQKHQSIYGVIIGTGIGGALWTHGGVYEGAHGGAGEPGEMVVDISNNLTLEQAYQKLTQGNTANLAMEAYTGDVLAEKSFDEFGSVLGIAFANIVNIVDPEVIVIGGGAVGASDLFLDKVRKTMKEYIASNDSKKKVKILKSKIGSLAGAVGAALLVE